MDWLLALATVVVGLIIVIIFQPKSTQPTISSLHVYPVKSMKGIKMRQIEINEQGMLVNDREYCLLFEKSGKMCTQRQLSKMCLIQPDLPTEEGIKLTLPSGKEIFVSRIEDGERLKVDIWGLVCEGVDQGDSVSDFLSDFLESRVRLVWCPPDQYRESSAKYGVSKFKFCDGFPALIISDASLDELNKKLETPVEMKRFRPNITISDTLPYAEDSWSEVNLGAINCRAVKPCSRCSIPQVDPSSGEREGEPRKTMMKYRNGKILGFSEKYSKPSWDETVFFGMNIIPKHSGFLNHGDQVAAI